MKSRDTVSSLSSLIPIGIRCGWCCAGRRNCSYAIRSGSSRDPRRAVPRPAVPDVRDSVGHPGADVLRAGDRVDPGQRGQEVQLVPGQSTSGASRRHVKRPVSVDVGLAGITQAQLEAGTEEIFHRGPDLGPPGGADQPAVQQQCGIGEVLGAAADLQLPPCELHRVPGEIVVVERGDQCIQQLLVFGRFGQPAPQAPDSRLRLALVREHQAGKQPVAGTAAFAAGKLVRLDGFQRTLHQPQRLGSERQGQGVIGLLEQESIELGERLGCAAAIDPREQLVQLPCLGRHKGFGFQWRVVVHTAGRESILCG